jgi:hypothetical protein
MGSEFVSLATASSNLSLSDPFAGRPSRRAARHYLRQASTDLTDVKLLFEALGEDRILTREQWEAGTRLILGGLPSAIYPPPGRPLLRLVLILFAIGQNPLRVSVYTL